MSKEPQKLPLYLKENIAALNDNSKLLSLLNQTSGIPENVTILTTKSRTITARYEDVLLHSLYDPEREALRFVASQKIRNGSHVLMYGFGLGYHVRFMLDAIGAEGTLFVLEPNVDILRAAFSLVDLRDVVNDARLKIITGEDEETVALRFLSVIERVMDNSETALKKIVVHQPSFQCMPLGFDKLKNSFEIMLLERRTPEVFEEINKKNVRKNVEYILKSPGIKTIRNQFKNIPAFFINAGPSLDMALPQLGRYCSRAIFFCSDTALPALSDAGIQPDFVITVDPQPQSFEHFKECLDSTATLVYSPTSEPRIVERYKGPKLVFLQENHSITRKFEDILNFKGTITAGSSVSCMGLDVLGYMGCNPVILVGVDYSFPGGKEYSSNVATTKQWMHHVHRLQTLENIHMNNIFSKKVIMVKDKYGNDVPTHQNLYAYLKQIETLIYENKETDFYTYYSQGAHIQGTEEICLSDEIEGLLAGTINKDMSLQDEKMSEALKEHILQTL